MPRGDGTGPNGLGSMTGRGLGYCAGYSAPGYVWGPGGGRGYCRGWGRGHGWGRGRGWGYAPNFPIIPGQVVASPIYGAGVNLNPEAQLNMFKQEKQYLESELENIKAAIADLAKNIEKLEQPK